MKLYAWHADGHGSSFFVLAGSEEQAASLVRAHIEQVAATDKSLAQEHQRYDWPRWHELKVYEAGQVAEVFGN